MSKTADLMEKNRKLKKQIANFENKLKEIEKFARQSYLFTGVYFFSTGTPAKVEALVKQMQRNPFFMPSGFTLQEKINISENKSNAKRVNKEIKERKKDAQRWLNFIKRKPKVKDLLLLNKHKVDQIQRGFDLAKKWGWGGTNKTYNPKLMKAR